MKLESSRITAAAKTKSRSDSDGYYLHNDEMGDELIDSTQFCEQGENAQKTHQRESWPSDTYVYLKFGYENTMKAQLEENGTTFASWIVPVMTHVQAYFILASLPTKIRFQVFNNNCVKIQNI